MFSRTCLDVHIHKRFILRFSIIINIFLEVIEKPYLLFCLVYQEIFNLGLSLLLLLLPSLPPSSLPTPLSPKLTEYFLPHTITHPYGPATYQVKNIAPDSICYSTSIALLRSP